MSTHEGSLWPERPASRSSGDLPENRGRDGGGPALNTMSAAAPTTESIGRDRPSWLGTAPQAAAAGRPVPEHS
jgi:hypothetical protein